MKAQSVNDNSRKPYNNVPLREGEVLVPMMVTREFAIGQGADPANLRTWTKSGIQFLVMFTAVPADQEQICQQNFDKAVNQMLDERIGPNRHSRCMVPQPDGTEKPCPKVKDGNHAPCATCPHKGEYKKEDRSTVSYEELDDENYAPMECAPSAETTAMEGFLLKDLLEYLGSINPVLADIVSMGYGGLEKKDIVQRLGVKSSQAYDLYKRAEKLTYEFLRG
ncbi:MAG: hypothetical protein IK099_02560 [Clostridia bacterium]|nr:hypothetical protein [Clostridia bacterium]